LRGASPAAHVRAERRRSGPPELAPMKFAQVRQRIVEGPSRRAMLRQCAVDCNGEVSNGRVGVSSLSVRAMGLAALASRSQQTALSAASHA